jgi:hypothetical protein
MTTLSKDEVLKLAKAAGMTSIERKSEYLQDCFERFAALCRADLVAENERLRQCLKDLDAFYDSERDALKAKVLTLQDAAWAVLSNEEHARSAGIHVYQDGSQTWQVYEDLRVAASDMKRGEA